MRKIYLLECGKGKLINVDRIEYIAEIPVGEVVMWIDKARLENKPNFAFPNKPTHIVKVSGVPILVADMTVTDLEEYLGRKEEEK